MLVCSSPKLFAAYRVLLRLLMPRHPSCALCSLTTKIIGVFFLKVSTHMGFSKVVLPACMAFSLFPYNSYYLYFSMLTEPANRFEVFSQNGGRTWI